jgi:uncharacterized protein (TIGR04562 family)
MLSRMHCGRARDEDAYRGALGLVQARLEPYLIDSSMVDSSPSDSSPRDSSPGDSGPEDSSNGTWIGDDSCRIPLVEFRIKTE